MYIFTEKHGIFNTNCIAAIFDDGKHIYALCNGTKYPLSYDIDDKQKIIDALKAGEKTLTLGRGG